MSPTSHILHGVRILSLALNLPGPAALMRCRALGATCTKLEPPAGDPMGRYSPAAYADLHQGVRVVSADLKSAEGQRRLHAELARSDVLLTSFRPSAIEKLGLGWQALHARYPALCQVAIVGAAGARAEEPGHDLSYMADNDLVTGLHLPPTLYADMGGSLMASEAVLKCVLHQSERYAGSGDPHPRGLLVEVPLADAAAYLGLPRYWGLTRPDGTVGGAHAGYRVYACRDGRVAVAALEPHFAAALADAAGLAASDLGTMVDPATHTALAAFFATRTRAQLDRLARERDIPLQTMAP